MRHLLLLALTFILMAATAQAASVGLDFNDNSFEARGSYDINQDQNGRAVIDGRFLYNDDKDSRLGSAGLRVMTEPMTLPGFSVGAGIKGYLGRTHHGDDLGNIGVGANVEFTPPALYGVGFGGKLYYAPKIFSFYDSDGLWEANLRTFYNFSPALQVYLGYQKVRGKFDNAPDQNLDSDLRLGLNLSF